MFFLAFPALCKFTFPIFWELYGFLLLPKYLRNPLLWNVCFFPILFPCYGNTLFPSSGNCMCFSIIFPYNGNPLFPYFGNCMYFCIQRKISETLKFEMFVFSHIFPLLWEFTFPIFWELHGFLLHPKYLRNFEMFVFFPYFSSIMRIHFSHMLVTAWISASSKKFQKPLTSKCSCFPIFFPYCANSLFSYSGNCMY